ncbi:MAG: hypothetical protein M1444_01955 [Patescibacteria group bacterium]|nr:hypothetical protein [Patescibacteria group bacterium]
MAKKKKTRQQKIIADLRRQINASQKKSAPVEKKIENRQQTIIPSLNLPQINLSETKQTAGAFANMSYLVKDLQKTTILTASIISFQLILLFILKNHIITLNGLIY